MNSYKSVNYRVKKETKLKKKETTIEKKKINFHETDIHMYIKKFIS